MERTTTGVAPRVFKKKRKNPETADRTARTANLPVDAGPPREDIRGSRCPGLTEHMTKEEHARARASLAIRQKLGRMNQSIARERWR